MLCDQTLETGTPLCYPEFCCQGICGYEAGVVACSAVAVTRVSEPSDNPKLLGVILYGLASC